MSAPLTSSTPDLFVHVHIHKCAGKAFGDLLYDSFGHRHLDMYREDLYESWYPEQLSETIEKHPRIESIASHNFRLFPQRIAGRQPLYTCFLRQPLEWFVSYLTYVKSNREELAQVHRDVLPANLDTIPLKELAGFVIDAHRQAPRTYSTFVHYLAESTYRMALADRPAWEAPLPAANAEWFRANGLLLARNILSQRFFFVGIVEEMDRSLHVLRYKLRQRGIAFAERSARQINVSRQHRDDLHWLDADQPLGAAAREWLKDDIQLYQWARRRFDAEFSQIQAKQSEVPNVSTDGDSGRSLPSARSPMLSTTIADSAIPWQTVDQQRKFIAAAGDVAGKSVLVVGDNVGVLVASLIKAGAKVAVQVSNEDARQRISRRFKDVDCTIRGPIFLRRWPRYDFGVLWDALGDSPAILRERLLPLTKVHWLCSASKGWVKCTGNETPADVIPDAITQSRLTERYPAPDSSTPVLVHVHTPKNGGTSVNNLMFESFGYMFQPAYTLDPADLHTAETMNQAIARKPYTLVTSSHSFRVFPDRLAGRPVMYFTFLRHPISRHLSYYRYARKHYDSFSEEHRKTLPENFMEMSPADYLEFESQLYRMGWAFGQTHLYSQGANTFDAARTALEKFLVVGCIEEADRGAELLRRKLAAMGWELVDLPVPHSNRTSDLYAETAELLKDPAIMERAGYLADDIRLYEWAVNRFHEEAAAFGM